MRIVHGSCARRGNILQAFNSPAFLDVVREITSCTVLYDEVNVPFALLDVGENGELRIDESSYVRQCPVVA